MRSNIDQLFSLLLFIGGAGLGGLIMYLWGFKLIDKWLERKNKKDV